MDFGIHPHHYLNLEYRIEIEHLLFCCSGDDHLKGVLRIL